MTNNNEQNTEESLYQDVIFGSDAHKELLIGAGILAKAVKSTMGPSGHNVIIDYTSKAPLITKDGVTVAKSINLKNNLQSIGAELLKEIASKTNEIAGDGTTTATVLGHGLLAQGIKMIATGRSSIGIKKGIDLACEEVIRYLVDNCVPVKNKQDIVSIGTISANGDVQIGELLAEAIERVGANGIITVEPAKSVNTHLDIVEGMQIDSGFISPYFVTNGEKLTCELTDPYVLISNKKISAIGDLLSILEAVHKTGKPLLIIAEEIEGEALHTLILNKMKGVMNVCAIKAPSYGEGRIDILEDISCVTGGTVIDVSSELQMKNVKVEQLGSCKKIIVGRSHTTFVGSQSEERKSIVAARVETIKNAIESGTIDELRMDRYRKRLAKLAGGIAIVKVGGSTEVEILERKDRVEDALNATVAASQEGIVPGGGTALFYAATHLREILKNLQVSGKLQVSGTLWKELNEDVIAGINIVANTCESPLMTIVQNTGVSPDVVANKLNEYAASFRDFKSRGNLIEIDGVKKQWSNPLIPHNFQSAIGYNAATHEYQNLLENGIMDPVKVTRYALLHACSIVGLMLTCDAVIVNEQK